MLFRYVILGSLVTVKAVRASINVSNISYKSCTLLCYVKKEKYMYLLSTKKKKFSQAYFIWAPKLDVPKIDIPLSKSP